MRRTRLERTADARTTTYGARSPHASSETPVLHVVLSHLFLHCNLEDSNNTRATRGLVDNYLQIAGAALAREPSPGIPPALSAHAHLRNGASIHAAGAPGGPMPPPSTLSAGALPGARHLAAYNHPSPTSMA